MILRIAAAGLFAIVVVVPVAGCDLISSWFQQDVDLPVDLTSPPQAFDVTAAVTSAEGSACAAPGQGCDAIKAICSTDNTRADCDTNPGLPDEFPAQVTVAGNSVDANTLMEQMGVSKATELKLALPVDVAGALSSQGVQSPDAIKKVKIAAVIMQWPENSLTFDAPPLDLYVSTGDVPPGPVDDVQALIDAGTIKKVGTVGIDTDNDGVFDIGQHAGATSDVPLAFAAGGSDLLSAAVTSAKFTIVTAVPDGKGMKLGAKPGDATKVLKPQGAGKIQLKATLLYTVSAADIVGAAH